MDVNLSAEEMNECVELMPINLYRTKLNIKQKICLMIKRTIDIVAGLLGCVLLIPITIAIYIAHKITKDERTNIL